ncbi:glycosyltransferase family 4 protein [Jannaschia sp. R86511]|uniref:glycosyltransferase family 4 protein n=1 Tax=Jannaschia sp. R86511 TaxID=3093853 RepID=UPI0036D2336D
MTAPTTAGRAPRVLVVVQNMNYAFDRRVQNEAKALVAAGIGVTVVCPKGVSTEPDLLEVDGVVVRSYPALGATAGVLSYLREFMLAWLLTARLTWRTHREEGFDLLQACNPPDTYWLLGLLWRLRGKRFVFDQHDLCPEVFVDRFGTRSLLHRSLHRTLLLLERATYRTAQHVLSPNESYREVALTRGRVPRERTTVVMSTPDHRIIRRTDPQPDARAGYAHLVAYVGVMGPQDGVDRLLRTARLRRDAGRDDTRYVLMGFGDCRDQLQELSRELGLDDCVHFAGRVSHEQLRAWLSAADLGVTPDPSTPFTERSTMNKTLEYMACELPVVASDLVETRRSAGDAALYVRTEQEAADAIDLLLDDPARRAEMGRLGRERITGELSWDRFAVDYVAAVRQVLGVGDPVVVGIPAQKRSRRRSSVRAR